MCIFADVRELAVNVSFLQDGASSQFSHHTKEEEEEEEEAADCFVRLLRCDWLQLVSISPGLSNPQGARKINYWRGRGKWTGGGKENNM